MRTAWHGDEACTAWAKATDNSCHKVQVQPHGRADQVQTCIQKATAFQRPCSVMSSWQYRSCSHSHPAAAGGQMADDMTQGQLQEQAGRCSALNQQDAQTRAPLQQARALGWHG